MSAIGRRDVLYLEFDVIAVTKHRNYTTENIEFGNGDRMSLSVVL